MTKTEMLAMLDKMAENIASIREALKADIRTEWYESCTTDLQAGSWHIIRLATYRSNPDLITFLGERSVEFSPRTGERLPRYVIGLSADGVTNQTHWTFRRYADSWEVAEQTLAELANQE